MMVNKVLTIAGSDSLSGGGIQADLATFEEYGVVGLSVITSIVTVQADSFQIFPMDINVIKAQLASVMSLNQIVAIKVGLLPTVDIINVVADCLSTISIPIIIDPVMIFKEIALKDGKSELTQVIRDRLLPLATVLTPNLNEAELLTNTEIHNVDDMKQTARRLVGEGARNVVIKGGARLSGDVAVDVLFDGEEFTIFQNEKVITPVPYNNGAGCTFSASIAANMTGNDMRETIQDAKAFVLAGIKNGVALNDEFNVGNVWQAARRLG